MSIAILRESFGEYARDTKLNLGIILSEEGAPGLTKVQIMAIALACAYATREGRLIESMLEDARPVLSPETVDAAKAASTVMAMNNVYYRTMHLAQDREVSTLPARLRMNVIGKPGIPKVDFELMCLAVSAINGCGACVNSHIAEVKKAAISNEGTQSAIRIAAVMNAVAQAIAIG